MIAVRPGFSLAELSVAIVLAGVVAAGVAAALSGAAAAGRAQAQRVRTAEALRVPAVVLAGELRTLDPRRDLAAVGPDTLRIRAARGAGIVCARLDATTLRVRYRGLRLPNPGKDSIAFLDVVGGTETTAALRESSRTDAACADPAGGDAFEWDIDAEVPPLTPFVLFENGSYHLADRAFRYRRGAAGRQPLTDERIDIGGSRFDLVQRQVASPDGSAADDGAESGADGSTGGDEASADGAGTGGGAAAPASVLGLELRVRARQESAGSAPMSAIEIRLLVPFLNADPNTAGGS